MYEALSGDDAIKELNYTYHVESRRQIRDHLCVEGEFRLSMGMPSCFDFVSISVTFF